MWPVALNKEHRLKDSDNWAWRKVCQPEREKSNTRMDKRANEQFHNLYFLPNIFWVIKSRRMRWAEHVVCIPGKKNA